MKLPKTAISTKGLASSGGNIITWLLANVAAVVGLELNAPDAIIISGIISFIFWYIIPERAFDAMIKRYKDRAEIIETWQPNINQDMP